MKPPPRSLVTANPYAPCRSAQQTRRARAACAQEAAGVGGAEPARQRPAPSVRGRPRREKSPAARGVAAGARATAMPRAGALRGEPEQGVSCASGVQVEDVEVPAVGDVVGWRTPHDAFAPSARR